jgi:hypothetical protein
MTGLKERKEGRSENATPHWLVAFGFVAAASAASAATSTSCTSPEFLNKDDGRGVVALEVVSKLLLRLPTPFPITLTGLVL